MTTNDQDEQLKKGYLIIPIGLPGYTQMPKSLDEFNMLRKQSEFPINSFKHKRSNMHPVSNIQNFPTETGVSLTCNFTPMKGGNGFILSCPNTVGKYHVNKLVPMQVDNNVQLTLPASVTVNNAHNLENIYQINTLTIL